MCDAPLSIFFIDTICLYFQGHINLDSLGKRGFHVPKKGTIQVVGFYVVCSMSA